MSIESERVYELAHSMMKLFIMLKPKKTVDSLNPIEFMVLRSISNEGNVGEADVTPTKICDELGLSKSALTGILNSLEEKNLIIRTLAKDDRRMILLTLTSEATKAMHSCHSYVKSSIHNLAEFLGEEDTENFIKLLNKSREFLAK